MASMCRIGSARCLQLKNSAYAVFPKSYSTTRKSISLLLASKGAFVAAPVTDGLYFGAKSARASLGLNSGYMRIFNNDTDTCHLNLKSQQLQQPQLRNLCNLSTRLQAEPPTLLHRRAMSSSQGRRNLCHREITKNMTLYTSDHFKSDMDPKTLEFKKPSGNPLVVMMAWLMAKQKHLKKYAEIYTEMGFDVVVVHLTPWQLLWPVKGSQVIAAELLKFLENNKSYPQIVIHGFSVGAYQFGEVMMHMSRDMDRYTQVLDRITCQIWDSAADITEIPVGVPKSIFPKNPRMQAALRNYTLYHLKTFHNQATVHYMRSSQIFHSTLVKKPALFFVSNNDLIGPPSSNNVVRENWERANIQVTFKCWDRSQHASHFIKHRDEYLELLFKHLESTGSLESLGLKSRAKL